ncbi:hypothetical protein ABEB36_004781 [Hypothenemus hampei]|uniref:Uncharacterized protein n=1 Tax=Hypothenemus hampei TaxID=57062 RepID=A0ABD1EWU5_HYPHA
MMESSTGICRSSFKLPCIQGASKHLAENEGCDSVTWWIRSKACVNMGPQTHSFQDTEVSKTPSLDKPSAITTITSCSARLKSKAYFASFFMAEIQENSLRINKN